MKITTFQSSSFQLKIRYPSSQQTGKKNVDSNPGQIMKNDMTSFITMHYQETWVKSKSEFYDQASDFTVQSADINYAGSVESNDPVIPQVLDEKSAASTLSDGYWGVEKTAGRIADFVISGAGDNLEKLTAGREGILKGFKEAEKIWGGNLPDICYQTIDAALEAVDEQIRNLNGSTLETFA